MSRAKSGKPAQPATGNSSSNGAATRWINVGLDDEGQRQCAELAADTPRLASLFLALHYSGLDTSIKRADNGEYMACLFGTGAAGQRLGLSGWGATPDDAIAGLLIKWHYALDGSFEGLVVAPEKARFR